MRASPSWAARMIASLLVLLVAANRSSASILYAVTYDFQGIGQAGELYTVDSTTGISTFVAKLDQPFVISQPMGLAFTNTGKLFTYQTSDLLEVNPTTGAMNRIGTGNPSGVEGDLTYDKRRGLFFAVGGSDHLITINPLTGQRTDVGAFGPAGRDVSGLAIDNNGNLWGLAMNDLLPDQIVRINPTTGAATVIGPTGTNATRGLAGLAVDSTTGNVYMSVTETNASLYSVNVGTGAATMIGTMQLPGSPPNNSIGFVSGMAFVVPEPSSALMFASAAVITLSRRCLRRRSTTRSVG